MAGLTPLKRQRPTGFVGDMIVLSLLLLILSFLSFFLSFGLRVKEKND
jgi:hypothetical protein